MRIVNARRYYYLSDAKRDNNLKFSYITPNLMIPNSYNINEWDGWIKTDNGWTSTINNIIWDCQEIMIDNVSHNYCS